MRRPRHQARQGRDHARHPERRRRGPQGPRRVGHRPHRRRGEAGRHPRRQDHAEGRDPALAGREAAPRDLRREGRRRPRHARCACRRASAASSSTPASSPARAPRRTSAPRTSRTPRRSKLEQGSARRGQDHLATPTTARCAQLLVGKTTAAQARRRQGQGAAREGRRRSTTTTLDDDPVRATGRDPGRSDEIEDEVSSIVEDARGADRRRQATSSARRSTSSRKGDELPPGVIKMVKVYIAIKRKLQVGDKMAGRHGNKGVVSRILPEEDMPYLRGRHARSTSCSTRSAFRRRMNVGQILETHLGWAARALGEQIDEYMHDEAATRKVRKEQLKKIYTTEQAHAVHRRARRRATWSASPTSCAAASTSRRRCSTARTEDEIKERARRWPASPTSGQTHALRRPHR